MFQPCGRFGVLFLLFFILIAPACGDNASGPSATATAAGTATIDGQIVQFTEARNASGGFRRPPNPAWPRGLLDIRLGNCDRPPALALAIYDGNPSPGRYEVPSFQFTQTEGAWASLQSPTDAAWNAGAVHRGSSGSITLSSASSTRVSGSFSLTLVQSTVPPGGIFGVPPPPLTKLVEGTFDLGINDRVVCP